MFKVLKTPSGGREGERVSAIPCTCGLLSDMIMIQICPPQPTRYGLSRQFEDNKPILLSLYKIMPCRISEISLAVILFKTLMVRFRWRMRRVEEEDDNGKRQEWGSRTEIESRKGGERER